MRRADLNKAARCLIARALRDRLSSLGSRVSVTGPVLEAAPALAEAEEALRELMVQWLPRLATGASFADERLPGLLGVVAEAAVARPEDLRFLDALNAVFEAGSGLRFGEVAPEFLASYALALERVVAALEEQR